MKKVYLAVIILLVVATAKGQQPVIVSPQWLNEHINDPDLVIVQPNFLRKDFEAEHIRGARFLWPDWLTANTPDATYNPPDPKAATKILQDMGISKNSKIILCHTKSDVSVTARMLVTLEYLGLEGKVQFLNGGLEAWKKAGYPVTNELSAFEKGNFVAKVNPVLVDKEYVMQALQAKSSEVIDARAKRWYDGDPTGNPRDGHIAGAKNIPYPELLDSTNSFKAQTVLADYFQPVVPDTKKELVSYCFIGQTASVVYLAGRQLGYKMKLYDGSMQEWSRIPELPMEKTPKEK